MQSKFLFNHQHVNQSISQSVHHLPLLFTNSDYLYLCLLGKALGFCIFFTKRFLVTFFWAVGWLVVFFGIRLWLGCWFLLVVWLVGYIYTFICFFIFCGDIFGTVSFIGYTKYEYICEL